jgi:hypothetical protein
VQPWEPLFPVDELKEIELELAEPEKLLAAEKVVIASTKEIDGKDFSQLETLDEAKNSGLEKLAKLGFNPAEMLAVFGLEPADVRKARLAANKKEGNKSLVKKAVNG